MTLNIRQEISFDTESTRLISKYDAWNNKPHNEITVYETLRSWICPKCKSGYLTEEWDSKYSIDFFQYECNVCYYKWDTLKKQIKFTFKLINIDINKKKENSGWRCSNCLKNIQRK